MASTEFEPMATALGLQCSAVQCSAVQCSDFCCCLLSTYGFSQLSWWNTAALTLSPWVRILWKPLCFARPCFPSLHSSRFLSFFRRRGSRSNKRVKKRASEGARLGWAKRLGRSWEGWVRSLTPSPYCLFCHSFAVFLPFASVWKRKGYGCYAGYCFSSFHGSKVSIV